MISTETLRNAHLELTRLNREMHELHLVEERCKLKRSRLEADKARVQSLVDICELAQRLNDAPAAGTRFTVPGGKDGREVAFRVEDCHGAKLVVVDKSATPVVNQAVRQKRKPDGLPTITEMVLAVLEGEEDGMRPRDITAIARRQWWPDLRPAAVNAAVWKLAGEGRVEKNGHTYKLNGHAGE
jgi:hypothetical protein